MGLSELRERACAHGFSFSEGFTWKSLTFKYRLHVLLLQLKSAPAEIRGVSLWGQVMVLFIWKCCLCFVHVAGLPLPLLRAALV